MPYKLYVGNLACETRRGDLELLFAASGTVREATLIRDRESGRSHDHAFITMATPEEARRASQRFNGHHLHGLPLTVNEVQNSESTGRHSAHSESSRKPGSV